MDNQIDFITEVNKYSRNFDRNIIVCDIDFIINLNGYNQKACAIINDWKTCLGMLGKQHLLKSKQIIKVVYCLLTGHLAINNVNGNNIDLDVYDPLLNRFLRIDIVDETERTIKLKIFSVCDTQIIIDCKNFDKYKIYELHNVHNIKEYYGTNKVNIDQLTSDIKLSPIFVGSLGNLENDYKILSIVNYTVNIQKMIQSMDYFMKQSIKLEKQIQIAYKDFINSTILLNI